MSEEMIQNGLLYGLKMPISYTSLEEESIRTINEGLMGFPNAAKVFNLLQNDEETNTLLGLANYIAVKKLGYNDHGPIHARIVTANGIKILKIIMDSKEVPLDSITGLGLTEDDAHVIVVASCLLHDVGNAVHREEHEVFSVLYAKDILYRLLPEVYPDVRKRTAIVEQILHALYAHDVGENALTIESAIVVIADGCDITKGRGRLAYDMGKHDIHSISALSIESVDISKGKTKLIEIHVKMSNSAGIYQVQETLGNKVAKSPLRDHIEIVADLMPSKAPPELRVLDRIVFSDGKYRNV
ncbi:MAG TPA: HD domain-containing protein, partial [Thermoplasmata archaeon]|nr:HD domain-containing protein [Thermoplasmata archaeon]